MLAYADVADLIGQGLFLRDSQMNNFKAAAEKIGLEVNEEKTKVMKVSRNGREEDFIDMGGLMREVVDKFKYLGSILTSSNEVKEEIKARIAAASKCSWAINDILKSNLISRRTKIQAYTTIIRPIATYGCETWALTKNTESMLTVFENAILRRILGPMRDELTGEWRRRHNVELRQLSALPPITSFIRSQRLRWAGHIARMGDETTLKMITQGVPEGRRPVGRPRKRWIDNIKQDLELLNIDNREEWWELAQDRRPWRRLVAAAKEHMGLQLQE